MIGFGRVGVGGRAWGVICTDVCVEQRTGPWGCVVVAFVSVVVKEGEG